MISLKLFIKEENGATMVEYAMMVGLVAVVCVAAVLALGQGVLALFNTALPFGG